MFFSLLQFRVWCFVIPERLFSAAAFMKDSLSGTSALQTGSVAGDDGRLGERIECESGELPETCGDLSAFTTHRWAPLGFR